MQAAPYSGELIVSPTSTFSITGTSFDMAPTDPAGDAKFYTVKLVPQDMFLAAGCNTISLAAVRAGAQTTHATVPTAEWNQTDCKQAAAGAVAGSPLTENCDSAAAEKKVTFTRPTHAGGEAKLFYTFKLATEATTSTLPDGSMFETPAGVLKMDIGVSFPRESQATSTTSDKLCTFFDAGYAIPATFGEFLSAGIKATDLSALADAYKATEDLAGCTNSVAVDAIFKVDIDFATSYSNTAGVASKVCPDAKDESSDSKVSIILEWRTVDPVGGTTGDIVVSVDPNFTIDNGSFSGGFLIVHLLIVIIIVIVLCCCCCCKLCGCFCFKKKDKGDPEFGFEENQDN